jgi:hypothetical protein
MFGLCSMFIQLYISMFNIHPIMLLWKSLYHQNVLVKTKLIILIGRHMSTFKMKTCIDMKGVLILNDEPNLRVKSEGKTQPQMYMSLENFFHIVLTCFL